MTAIESLNEFMCSKSYPNWVLSLPDATKSTYRGVDHIRAGYLEFEHFRYRFTSIGNGIIMRNIEIEWWYGGRDLVVSETFGGDIHCHKGFKKHMWRVVRGLKKLGLIPKK